MIVNSKLKFVFFGVPRAASTSIEHALKDMPGSEWRGKHLTELRSKGRSYFSFACVRNPYSREYSHFRYRRKKHSIETSKLHHFYKDVCAGSFEEYAEWSTDVYKEPLRYHDFPQYQFLAGSRVDHLLRFETLKESWKELGERFPAIANQELPHLHKGDTENWKTIFNQRTADLIYEWAKEDFDHYGYDRDSWKVD